MQYESKVVKLTYFTDKLVKIKLLTESELEETINKLGLVGWQLVSTSFPNTREILLFFSRPKQSLEEMV